MIKASGRILLLTHSSRETDYTRCSLNFLTARYSSSTRLQNLPDFEDLPSCSEKTNYTGSLSFFRIAIFEKNFRINYIGSIKSARKIQHAVQLNATDIVVCYESSVEIWIFNAPLDSVANIKDLSYKISRKIDNPHFSGLHTVNLLDDQRTLISASGPDAIIILNLSTGLVEQEQRLPAELYGLNYRLSDEMDLREHCIGNDYQTTHINSAFPSPDGNKVVVSTLIQGAIGIYDLKDKQYREICRGYIGCHGARFNDEGKIYFADSVNGNLIILDRFGKIYKRFAVRSFWLHDVIQITGDIYAFSLADKNELIICNISNSSILYRKKFLQLPNAFHFLADLSNSYLKLPLNKFILGNSTQFISIR